MAENPDDSAGDTEKARSGAATQDGSEAVGTNLPMVVAPKLGAGEDEAVDEKVGDAAEETITAASPAHSSRFLMLAASVAFAAAFGSFVGSVSGTGLVRLLDPAAPAAPAANVQTTTDAMRQTKLELAELAAIKANLDSTTRSTTGQLAKLSDRLDKLDQSSIASAETTGSIATTSPPPATPKLTDRSLAGLDRAGCAGRPRLGREPLRRHVRRRRGQHASRRRAGRFRSSVRTVSGSC